MRLRESTENPNSMTKSGYLENMDSLYVALHALRLTEKARLLWVDAVCIFQNHSTEKSQQIRMMYSIYSYASEVLVWLGPQTPHSELAFEFIDAHQDVPLTLHLGTSLMSRRGREGGDPFPKYHSDIAIAFRQLLGHPWFTRIWIFQESVANVNMFIL
jgi:hypothetical protein